MLKERARSRRRRCGANGEGRGCRTARSAFRFVCSDALLASQFFARLKSVAPSFQPIQKLMLAVLADGIDELFVRSGPVRLRERRRAEAKEWLFDDARTGPFSFDWICGGLEIDASWLRAGIRRIEERMCGKIASSNGL